MPCVMLITLAVVFHSLFLLPQYYVEEVKSKMMGSSSIFCHTVTCFHFWANAKLVSSCLFVCLFQMVFVDIIKSEQSCMGITCKKRVTADDSFL